MQKNSNHTLLTERFRPSTLDGFIGTDHVKQLISKQIADNDIQNYLFWGPAGVGKSTLAKIIVNNIDCEYIIINASDERGIDTIREKVIGFAATRSFAKLKVVVLEESDHLTNAAQASLRAVIEEYSENTRFIFTCNYIEKMIDPIQSRCQVVTLVPPSKAEVAEHIANICDEEEIKYAPNDIKQIVNQNYPDIRKMLNILQASNIEGTINLDRGMMVSLNYIDKIINELKKSKPSFSAIRQLIVDSDDTTFVELYRQLFDRVSEYMPGKEGTAIIYINEAQYHGQFSIDKQINICALLYNLIQNK